MLPEAAVKKVLSQRVMDVIDDGETIYPLIDEAVAAYTEEFLGSEAGRKLLKKVVSEHLKKPGVLQASLDYLVETTPSDLNKLVTRAVKVVLGESR